MKRLNDWIFDSLAMGDDFLGWLVIALAGSAGLCVVALGISLTKEAKARRRSEGIETARRLQAELDRRFGRQCGESVAVGLAQGRVGEWRTAARVPTQTLARGKGFFDEGLYESDEEFYADIKSDGLRGWDS